MNKGTKFCRRQWRWFKKTSKQGPFYRLLMYFYRIALASLVWILKTCFGSYGLTQASLPSRLFVKRVTSTSAKFCWVPGPVSSLESSSFELQLCSRNGEWKTVCSGNMLNFRYCSFVPEELVMARVRSKNSQGPSAWCSTVTFRTRQLPVKQGGFGPSKAYAWDQSSKEIKVTVPFPAGTKSSDIDLRFTPLSLRIADRRSGLITEGTFYAAICSDSPPWTLVDDLHTGDRVVTLHLDKAKVAERKTQLWPCLLKEHPRIDLRLLIKKAVKVSSNSSDHIYSSDEDDIGDDDGYFDAV